MTQYITLEGEGRWLRLTKERMDTKFGEKFNLDLSLDEKNLAKIKGTGWRGKVKEDEDGVMWAKFSRNNTQDFGGKIETLGPPKLYEADGRTPWDASVEIGNGSRLSITLEVYESKKYGVGSRLLSVAVLSHVPYVRTEQTDLPI